DETALFLHRAVAGLPADKAEVIRRLRQHEPALVGRKVLIIDDDVRNLFSLTSMLEQHQIEVRHAETGQAGIDQLEHEPGVDLVLMDIMMPGMDGYETRRAIRARDRFKKLPIVAVTAKAMKGDRERCIEAGASDYLAKPVDSDHLMSILRVWMR